MTQYDHQLDVRMRNFNKYLERSGLDSKPYQVDGVRWCLNNELRPNPLVNVRGGFLADEMGLGKTITMIGLMLCNSLERTLIVLPPVLIGQWYLKIYQTTGYKPLIYKKKGFTDKEVEGARIVLVSYEGISVNIRKQNVGKIHALVWSRIIFDEAHHLRNKNTSRYFGAKLLRSPIRWLVSGTPVQNKKQDFYALCSALRMPASFYTEPDNLRILAKNFILKRTKEQAGVNLPNVTIQKSSVEWENKSERLLSQDIHSALNFSKVSSDSSHNLTFGSLPLQMILRARQSCILPRLMKTSLQHMVQRGALPDFHLYQEGLDYSSKMNLVLNHILERKGNGNGKLIFCHYREEIDEIVTRLAAGGITNVATFDGRVSFIKRQQILQSRNDVLILQIQTGCEGLNLQDNYSEIYFISPHWNPAVEDQAVARCHRIGQLKQVSVYKFEMQSFAQETLTIDSYVTSVQERKREVAKEYIE